MAKEKDKEEKIKDLWLKMRCVKQTLNYDDKKFEVFVIKDTDARATFKDGIVVNDAFFNRSSKEQLAVLYHEEYHLKGSTICKGFYYRLKFLSLIKAKWQEEFDADSYAKEKAGKKPVIGYLKYDKKMYETGKIKYDPKTHPPIEDRIKNIEK